MTAKGKPVGTTDNRPVELLELASLKPYERNARTHSEDQVKQIVASIREWGWTNPMFVDENYVILAGHGRRLAALEIGLKKVPCIVARGWTAAQKRAYVLADNRLAEQAGWDKGVLRFELDALMGAGFNLDLTGFSAVDVRGLLAGADGNTDPDDVPETPKDPVSRPGDIWILGEHRIACGSSTDADTVARVLAGAVPHLMVTDPPYGVEYDASWRTGIVDPKNGNNKTVRATGKVLNDDKADWREAWALFPGAVAYVWHAGVFSPVVADSLAACEFEIRSQIIWAKQQFAIGRGNYHWQHEPAWYAVRKGRTAHFVGDRKQSTLWQIDKPHRSETGHSTQKPIECMQRPIENNSKPGDSVYEPFSGSGTTIIACERTGRKAYAIELNPAYVDVAVARWQAFTGKAATREADGVTFDALLPEAA